MKFLAAVLALPAAVLAAPAPAANPPNFVMDSIACGCANAAGKVSSSGTCQLMSGEYLSSGGLAGYCYRATAWAPEMNTVFNDAICNPGFDGDHTKAVCKPVKLCLAYPDLPGYKDYYQICSA